MGEVERKKERREWWLNGGLVKCMRDITPAIVTRWDQVNNHSGNFDNRI